MDKQVAGENVAAEFGIIKSKMVEIEHNRLEYYSSHLEQSSILEEEKMNIYQISTQLKKQKSSTLNVSKVGEARIEPTKVAYQHFKENFALEPVENQTFEDFRALLNDASQRELIGEITENELKETICKATKKKYPDPDGINYEFYAVHFDLLKQDLLCPFNGFLNGNLKPLENFSSGIITLIHKSGISTDLNNFRPISLLNTDYKILMKILANRFSKIMNQLLDVGQTVGKENESCVDNLEAIRNLIVRAQQSKKFKFILLSLDLEKAFDAVNHLCLWKILEKLRIPENIIHLLKSVYAVATSRVLVNGFLTSSFKIGRSVRQGCPMSMILFSLYIEPQIRTLYNEMSGILIGNKFYKIFAYADDLTLVVRNEQEFDMILEIIGKFSRFANIRMNFKKSGFIRLNECRIGPTQIKEEKRLKILA